MTNARINWLVGVGDFAAVKKIGKGSKGNKEQFERNRLCRSASVLHKHLNSIEEKPSNSDLWNKVGDIYDLTFNFKKKAIHAFEQALAFSNGNLENQSKYCFTLGLLYEELKMWKKSKEYYKRDLSLALNEDDIDGDKSDKECSVFGVLRCSFYSQEGVDSLISNLGLAITHCRDAEKRVGLKQALDSINRNPTVIQSTKIKQIIDGTETQSS